MTIQFDFDLLQQLTAVPGVFGREKQIAQKIAAFLRAYGLDPHIDALHNVSATIDKPNTQHILFLAHSDEIGLIVRRVDGHGFLLVERLGGFNTLAAHGTQVDVQTRSGLINGIIGVLPAHLSAESRANPPSINDFYIDIGAESVEEAHEMGVRIGDAILWRGELKRLGKHKICGKALDDRLGCTILLQLAQYFSTNESPYSLTFAFVSQEESATSEATPIIRQHKPDFVIGIDGTLPFDTPDLIGKQADIHLGKGVCLKYFEAIRGKVTFAPDIELTHAIADCLERHNIPYQSEVAVGMATAAATVPYMNSGIRTAALSVPIRYHHTAIESADIRDIESAYQAILTLITSSAIQ